MLRHAFKILLIEDNDGDALLIKKFLKNDELNKYEITHIDRLGKALVMLELTKFDIILLDLTLPDSQGYQTVELIHEKVPLIPIIVLTGFNDPEFGIELVRKGVQDYILKDEMSTPVLTRSVRYSYERKQAEIEQLKQWEQQERELSILQDLVNYSQSPVTSGIYGIKLLSETAPDIYQEMLEKYESLLEKSLEETVFKVNRTVSEELKSLAEVLGFLKGGPRDVIEIHSTILKKKTNSKTPNPKMIAYMDEGRIMVLQLMGYLTAYYRNHSFGFRSKYPPGHLKNQLVDKE